MKVLTIGTFDLLHEGHLNLFHACEKLAAGGEVVVGVNSDEFVFRYKGIAPVQNSVTRLSVVSCCRYVTRTKLNTTSGHALIRQEQPDVLVVGSDWAAKDYYNQIGLTRRELVSMNILLVYVPYTDGVSTSQIRRGAGL